LATISLVSKGSTLGCLPFSHGDLDGADGTYEQRRARDDLRSRCVRYCRWISHQPDLAAMPVTFAASCAFMMPISTPPNAVLFATGYIKMKK